MSKLNMITWTRKHLLIVVTSLMLVIGFTATLALHQLAHAAPQGRKVATITPITTTGHTTAQGFDICQAPPLDTMQKWWATSPYRWVNIYMGGLNRACPHGPSAQWIAAVYDMGWGLVPTYVGYQAPRQCLPTGVRGAGMNTDPFIAQFQGREAALDAIASAHAIGLDAGTIIYYDLEYYHGGNAVECNPAVAAYVNGWDQGLHSAGYKAGLYIASTNVGAVESAPIEEPDAVWLVNSGYKAPGGGYAADCTVYGNTRLDDSAWHGHRLYQYLVNNGAHLDHSETWGGATLTIDSDCADGDIVGHDAPLKLPPSFSYIGQNADGRLLAFARGDDNAIWFAEQNKPNGLWSTWTHLGTLGSIPVTLTFAGTPQVAQLIDGRLAVFARGTDGTIWSVAQTAPNKPFGDWQPIAGPRFVGNPSVTRNADGSALLVALGADGNIWGTSQATAATTWAPWQPLQAGQRFVTTPAVAQDADGRVEVFAVGTDGNVWVNFQRSANRDWFGWIALQPTAPTLPTTAVKFTGVPTTVRNHDGRLTVFARGTDGSLWQDAQKTQGGTWSGWTLIPTAVPITGDPTVAVNPNGLLTMLALGQDGNLWDSQQTATGWLAWTTLEDGVTFTGTPAIGTSADGRLVAFALGTDGNLWAAQQQNPGGAWSTWAHLEDGFTFAQ